MAVASVVREIEAEIAREEERRSREEMILDPASAPEMLPAGSAVLSVPEELPYSPPPAPSIPEGPSCGAGAVCGASARGAAGEVIRTASTRRAASEDARAASTRGAASRAVCTEGDTR